MFLQPWIDHLHIESKKMILLMSFLRRSSKPSLLVLILIFGLIVIISCQEVQAEPVYNYHACLDPSNDTATATYQSNLSSLLDSLSSKASLYSFYNETSNGIYGLFQCRGDVSIEKCQMCVKNASQELPQRCPSNKRGVIWYDQCLLRYSNINFFGVVRTDPRLLMWNVLNTTSPDEPNYGQLGLVYTLIDRAQNSDTKFAADETPAAANGSQRRYGLVQCSRDLNSSACNICLGELANGIQQCCQGKRGWRIISPSCYIRYEEYNFFNQTSSDLAPPPIVPAPPQSVPNEEGGKGGKNTKNIVIIVISSLAAAFVSIILGFWCYWSCRKKGQKGEGTSEEIPLRNFGGSTRTHMMEGGTNETDEDHSGEMHYFSFPAIQAATNNFSGENKLGEGGFGPVYKGKMPNGTEIAVKRLSLRSSQGLEEFKNEVKLIIKLQHKNLVRLLGYCLEEDEKLLVYEYMANTSLDAFLFDPTKSKVLDWERRANIINGTARGLQYLHEDSRLKIIHRDMKPSNILLDDEMNPKISDFGTARIFGGKQMEANTERVVGTYGYMAPEYALEGLFSVKSDVYSFGVLMLEIISGKKNRGIYPPDSGQSLHSYAWQLWNEGRGQELIDSNIVDDCPIDEALRWIHIALLCIQDDPAYRPTMSSVVLMLGSKSVNLPQPSMPPYSAARFLGMSGKSSSSLATTEPHTSSGSIN